MMKWIFAALIFATCVDATAIKLEIQYQDARSGEKGGDATTLVLPELRQSCVSNDGIYKTLFAIDLANLIQKSLVEYSRPFPCVLPPRYLGEEAEKLLMGLGKLQGKYTVSGSDVNDAVDMVKKLADNMVKGNNSPPRLMGKMMNAAPMACQAAGGLNVTGGGVKDYSHFKKQVRDGFVPVADAFIAEGFLSAFNLTLPGGSCDRLIGLNPGFAFDSEARKLFVQVGMTSSVMPESFSRRPVNLAFVIDISGSMAATDFTERTRLEWAKDVIVQALSRLNENDFVSIVLFDHVSEVLLPPTAVIDRESIVAKVRSLHTRGSTNLDAGLRDGYQLVSRNFRAGAENRVILISDAGLNTGVTDPTSILRLVTDYAEENIGLTAIGIGENFRYDFVHKVTMSKGGNAVFVHSGAEMVKFFKNFDYLVTPVAYHLKLSAAVEGLNAKLVNTYGVPKRKDEPLQELINVRTLFFSEEGGAIVLEFDVN